MGLWTKIQRYAAAGLITATATLAQPASADTLESRIAHNERALTEERTEKRTRWLLAGTLGALGMLGIAHVVKRKLGQKPALLQPAVDHPYLALLGTAVSYSLPYAVITGDPARTLAAGAIPGAMLFLALRQFALVRAPYLLNTARYAADGIALIAHQLSNSIDAELAVLERMRTYTAHPSKIAALIAGALFAHDRLEDGLATLKDMVRDHAAQFSQTAYEKKIITPLAKPAIAALQRLKPFARAAERRKRHDALGKMNYLLFTGDITDALNALDDLVIEPSPSRFAARAYIFQHLADNWKHYLNIVPNASEAHHGDLNERARHAWQDCITAILSTPGREQDFVRLGESRNEVLEYRANEFLKDLLIFKRCDGKDVNKLYQERQNAPYVRGRIGNEIVKSIAYVVHDGKAYHVLRHETNKTLEQVLQRGTRDEQCERTAMTASLLARIHKLAPPTTPIITADTDYYRDRIGKCLLKPLAEHGIALSAELKNALRAFGERVADKLKRADIGWYKDANPRNWLVADHRMIAIDFEHNALLPIQLDLVSMLEFGPAPAPLAAKIGAFKQYLSAFYGEHAPDRRTFFAHYRWAALQRHLELAGYRMRDKEYASAQDHIVRATHYANKLGEHTLTQELATITITGGAASAGRSGQMPSP